MKRLLPLEHFDAIFKPLAEKRVYFHDGIGTVGDLLITIATGHLLKVYNIWRVEDFNNADVVLLFGGGNFGDDSPHAECRTSRKEMAQKAKAEGKEVIVLPQTAHSPEEGEYDKVFVRDHTSLKLVPNGILAPDLVLGFQLPDNFPVIEPFWATGLFLREDSEKTITSHLSLGDPALRIQGVANFLQIASRFEHVVTNRLHFAIAAMIVGRKATLLPGNYHKNKSVWETWLKDLGCEWSDTIPDHY